MPLEIVRCDISEINVDAVVNIIGSNESNETTIATSNNSYSKYTINTSYNNKVNNVFLKCL